MESIEKLRRMSRMFDSWHEEHMDGEPYIEVRHYTNGQRDFDSIGDRIRELLDEIEAEISDRYMELPLDADGVPIHPGDTVYAVDGGWCIKDMPLFLASNRLWAIGGRRPDELTHAKPRTIEDVLDDYRRELVETWACTLDDEMTDAEDEITARYADELHDLMGVEE